MKTHHNKTMTVYDLPKIAKIPLQLATTPATIQSGFRISGIYLTNLFNEAEADLDSTLESVMPYPKASPRKPSNRGRKRRKTAVLTDDEFVDSLREERIAASKKQQEIADKRQRAAIRKQEVRIKKQQTAARKQDAAEKKRLALLKKQQAAENKKGKKAAEIAAHKEKPSTSTGKRGRQKNIPLDEFSDSDSDTMDDFCCICGEVLPYVATNQRCTVCRHYAHSECTRPGPVFICLNCDSDGCDTESSQTDEGEDDDSSNRSGSEEDEN